MARTLSGPLTTKIGQQYGAEPLTVVKIEWPAGTRYYSDKAYTFGVNVCEAKILDLGNIVSQARTDASSEVGSASISLDDTDATIKNSVNRDLMAGTKVTIYQTYSGLSVADSLIVLAGRISNDIAWSEGQRTIGFTVDTSFYIGELGHAPKKGDLANLSVDAEGKLWPIVFGSCLNVPAVQIYKSVYGDYPNSEAMSFTPGSTFYVSGGENFPSGSIKIRMKQGVCLEGSFTGNLFTVATNNVAYHTNLSIAARVADADELNPNVLWLTGQRYLVGQYCYIDDGANTMSNLCTYQEGKKCWFAKPWKVLGQNTPVALATGIIDETSHFYRTAWTVPFTVEILVGSTWTPVNYYTTWKTSYAHDVALVTTQIPTYIVNYAPSTIKSVYAYRTYMGKRTLEQVPTSYYTKYNSTTIDGKTVAALEFHNELTDYVDEGWEQDVFVSLTSSLSANTSAVIEYLLETYTAFTVDGTFATVATKIANYPSNFAVLNQQDVLSLVADIAFQARLAVRFDGSVAKLYYLSEIPSTIRNFTDDYIAQKSLDFGFTSVDDIVTKYTAKWRPSYTAKDAEYVYKNNIATFGNKEDERDYFIYNIESLVVLSVNFWGNRLSNSWRTCRLGSFLSALAVETFDCVSVATSTLSGAGIRGEVLATTHDTMNDLLNFDIKLASKSGVHSSGAIIEDTTFFTGGVTGAEPAPADPTNGLAERDYVVYHEPKENTTPGNKVTKYIKFTVTPELIVRGQAFSISAKIINQDESVFNVNETFNFTVSTSVGSETPNIGTITFTNGLATVNRSVTGGSTDTEAVLNIVGKTVGDVTYQTALSDGIPITSEPTLAWGIDHTAVARGSDFTVTITGGLPSTTYTITLDSQDASEELYNAATPVTSFTTDASGNYTATWHFADGVEAINSVNIIATHAGHAQSSPEFIVIAGGGGKNVAFVGKIISKSSGLIYNVTIYPDYPALTPAWTATVTQLQGDSAQTIPANTWAIIASRLKDGFSGTATTDFDHFMQVPIWL
jgi:hypothetical protein